MADPAKEIAFGVLKRVTSEAIKQVPLFGWLLDIVIFGQLDDAEKIEDKRKLDAALAQLQSELGEQGAKLKQILDFLHANAGLSASATQRLGEIGARLEGLSSDDAMLERLASYCSRAGISSAELEVEAGDLDSLLQKVFARELSDKTRVITQKRIAESKLYRHHAEDFIGRETELAQLQAAWDDGTARVQSIIAWGGAGKTALVAAFRAGFAPETRTDCDGYLDWSFYQQGASSRDGSSESFFTHALAHLGIDGLEGATAQQKAAAIADRLLLGPWLLILDGLEPLQHPPGSANAGKLRDPGLRALLRLISERDTPGLCLLTSREKIESIGVTAAEHIPVLELEKLSPHTGARLLHRAGADHLGATKIPPDHAELQTASDELRGHPLSLQILGGYLQLAHDGDIRQRGAVALTDAASDSDFTRRNVQKLLDDYVVQLEQNDNGRRMLAVLRLLGLFDRPAQRHCLDKLREAPRIAGLNDGLFEKRNSFFDRIKKRKPIDDRKWRLTLQRLTQLKLIEPSTKEIDCHPLIRGYFAGQLKSQAQVWQSGHLRLYMHLCGHTELLPQGEAGLQPLYQAIMHGCFADKEKEALNLVYVLRILRGTRDDGYYSSKTLGLFANNLVALGNFFASGEFGPDWHHPKDGLNTDDYAWLLNEVAFNLRAQGRLDEARLPMAASLDQYVRRKDWANAARTAGNLSEIALSSGDLSTAIQRGTESVEHADRSKNLFQRMKFRGMGAAQRIGARTTHADALHKSGEQTAARTQFEQAEQMQAHLQPYYPLLYGLAGFRYADLLLDGAERASWRASIMLQAGQTPRIDNVEFYLGCNLVAQRTTVTLGWVEQAGGDQLSIALEELTFSRASFYLALVSNEVAAPDNLLPEAEALCSTVVDRLRTAGYINHLPCGLLTRAWLRRVQNNENGSRTDLSEARQISEAGSMKLHLADIALYEARLFGDLERLAEARQLIEETGYHRRDGELADAEEMLLVGGDANPR